MFNKSIVAVVLVLKRFPYEAVHMTKCHGPLLLNLEVHLSYKVPRMCPVFGSVEFELQMGFHASSYNQLCGNVREAICGSKSSVIIGAKACALFHLQDLTATHCPIYCLC